MWMKEHGHARMGFLTLCCHLTCVTLILKNSSKYEVHLLGTPQQQQNNKQVVCLVCFLVVVSWNQFTNLMVFGSRLALFRQLAEVINATDIINLFKSFGPVKKFDWIYDVLHTKLEVYNPSYYNITFGVERQNPKYYLRIVCLFHLVFRHFGSHLALFHQFQLQCLHR